MTWQGGGGYSYSQCCLERVEIMGNNGGCIRLGRKRGNRLEEEWRQSRRSQTFIYKRKRRGMGRRGKEEKQDRAVSI